MSDEKTDNTDEPTKAELHDRVQQLESTVEKLMPSRRDALRMGAAGLAGAAGLGAASQSADAATGSAGQIGDVNNRPDVFADTVDANSLTGSVKNQGCRVFLSSDQNISAGNDVKIQFDSEVYDSDNNFDTGSHSWTCPQTGVYIVSLMVSFFSGANGDDRRISIGTSNEDFPNNEGSVERRPSSDKKARIGTTTVNRYQSGDSIAGYARNANSNDTVLSGSLSSQTTLEVAFVGVL